MSVNNLAIRLGEAGRHVEGLAAAQEALDLYRELVERLPEKYVRPPNARTYCSRY